MSRRRKDAVRSDVAWDVFQRDRWTCVASIIASERQWAIDACRDKWGGPAFNFGEYRPSSLTLDHVQQDYGMMGKRAPSDADHLVTLCWHHHMNGWATSHKPELRSYLARFRPSPEELP